MSELKAHKIIGLDGRCNSVDNYYYLKSEADKVIAKLKSELDRYKRGWEESDRINAHLYAEICHSNYKRCLAMANVCREAICYWDNVKYTYFKGEAHCFRKVKHYGRWGQIWLAIAEKFKPNNSTAQ